MDVAISVDNCHVLNHTRTMLCGNRLPAKRSILKDAFEIGAKFSLPKRKLDQWGRIKSQCALINSPESLNKYWLMLQMSDSIATIQKMTDKEKEEVEKL